MQRKSINMQSLEGNPEYLQSEMADIFNSKTMRRYKVYLSIFL
jgi:hypothetical protein